MSSKQRRISLPLLIFLLFVLAGSPIPKASADDALGHHLLVLLHPIESPSRSQLQEAQIIDEWDSYLSGSVKNPPDFLGSELQGLPLADVDFLITDNVLSHFGLARDLTPLLDDSRSRLHRYLSFRFSDKITGESVLPAVLARSEVMTAEVAGELEWAAMPNDPFFADPGPPFPPESFQWGAHSLYLAGAWNWSQGGALIGVADSGVETTHPDLIAFNASNQYVGGNYLSNLAWDTYADDEIVNEVRTYSVVDTNNPCWPQFTTPSDAPVGHGTHVAGILAASTNNGIGVAGTCPLCKLFVAKVSGHACNPQGTPVFATGLPYLTQAFYLFAESGVQVINVSMTGNSGEFYCGSSTQHVPAFCVSLELAKSRGVLVVAASGNRKTLVGFPANDPGVVAVGGISENEQFWDEVPGTTTCPTSAGCGSNFSFVQGDIGYTIGRAKFRQELVAPARNVFSTFYRDRAWIETGPLKCMDDDQQNPYDNEIGYGLCTGTSMSAPFVAGIAAILRSLNPLIPPGDQATTSPFAVDPNSVRGALIQTTREAQAQQSLVWNKFMGYGLVDAETSARRVLGTVGGETVSNRAIPLFGVYSNTAMDYAYSTSPQAMISFRLLSNGSTNLGYDLPVGGPSSAVPGDPVPGYPAFPDPVLANHPVHPMFAPRASMYVLAGHKSPLPGHALLPLYRMTWTGSGNNRDVAFVTSDNEINSYYASGYKLERLEGYIYEPCDYQSVPSCQPIGTEPLFRMRNATRSDHALALGSSQQAAYINDGYVNAPLFGNTLIGFAYATTDNDEGVGDGIPDGFELALGLDPTKLDSDCDGVPDGVEWPIAGLPVSDPLDGECPINLGVQAFASTSSSPAMRVSLENFSDQVLLSGTVRITVGWVDASLWDVAIVGPGNCDAVPQLPLPPGDWPLLVSRAWDCTVENVPGASVLEWRLFDECIGAPGAHRNWSITLLDSIPSDDDSSNNHAFLEGGYECSGAQQ